MSLSFDINMDPVDVLDDPTLELELAYPVVDHLVLTSAEDTSPIESRSKLPSDKLPPNSIVYPSDQRNGSWTVSEDGNLLTPMPPDSGLEVRNASQSASFANGTKAYAYVGYREFVKVPEGWKRVRRGVKEDGTNVKTNGLVIGTTVGLGGFGNFLEIQHPANYAGGGTIETQLQDVKLEVPLSLAATGQFFNSSVPALQVVGAGNLPQKLSVVVEMDVSTGATKTYKSAQFNTRAQGNSLTLGQLAGHAAKAVIALMKQERGEGSILCVNNLEIDTDDLFLIKLVQVSQGCFRVKVGVRKFEFQLPRPA